jgi:hypothetical protein
VVELGGGGRVRRGHRVGHGAHDALVRRQRSPVTAAATPLTERSRRPRSRRSWRVGRGPGAGSAYRRQGSSRPARAVAPRARRATRHSVVRPRPPATRAGGHVVSTASGPPDGEPVHQLGVASHAARSAPPAPCSKMPVMTRTPLQRGLAAGRGPGAGPRTAPEVIPSAAPSLGESCRDSQQEGSAGGRAAGRAGGARWPPRCCGRRAPGPSPPSGVSGMLRSGPPPAPRRALGVGDLVGRDPEDGTPRRGASCRDSGRARALRDTPPARHRLRSARSRAAVPAVHGSSGGQRSGHGRADCPRGCIPLDGAATLPVNRRVTGVRTLGSRRRSRRCGHEATVRSPHQSPAEPHGDRLARSAAPTLRKRRRACVLTVSSERYSSLPISELLRRGPATAGPGARAR